MEHNFKLAIGVYDTKNDTNNVQKNEVYVEELVTVCERKYKRSSTGQEEPLSMHVFCCVGVFVFSCFFCFVKKKV